MGGQSRRMGNNKSQIQYFSKPHVQHMFELLKPFCEKVFVSCREDQSNNTEIKSLPQIHDSFLNMGPLGGILSAFKTFPNAAWLVFACDLPFVEKNTIQTLLKNRNPFRFGSAFKSSYDDLPEPLGAVYEPRFYPKLLQFVGEGGICPRKILIQSRVELIEPPFPSVMDNVNFPEELKQAKRIIKKRRTGNG